MNERSVGLLWVENTRGRLAIAQHVQRMSVEVERMSQRAQIVDCHLDNVAALDLNDMLSFDAQEPLESAVPLFGAIGCIGLNRDVMRALLQLFGQDDPVQSAGTWHYCRCCERLIVHSNNERKLITGLTVQLNVNGQPAIIV